ncbi:2-C-methyl-D-erythritol 4-phosphate cytidylyltransferase [Pseudokineococcus basanitobsidens]|uniref:2-C-methyl-D-erythritol 4-phosphate cytidylyltransferase n=1 Tax=Pseudokineococcus basanitobsidens TaxID=1926649 RepID=A0ABU8RGI2_9ACTN
MACVLVAAGAGTRLAAGRPKAYVPVAGTPLLELAARGVVGSGVVDQVVVVVPRGLEAETRTLLDAVPGLPPSTVVPGGTSRQGSVAAGLAAVAPGAGVVLVHDAARALTPPGVVRRVVEAVRDQGHDAVVPAVPVHDTLRDTGGGVVDRSRLRAVQTPQGFSAAALRRAHAAVAVGEGASDDAGLVEATGVRVHVVLGDPEAFKVTTPLDLLLAHAVVTARATGAPAEGTGP